MDAIQKTLIKAGRKDLAQKYYYKVMSFGFSDDLKYANKYKKTDETLLANNTSVYSWEDLSIDIYALLFANNKGILRLLIMKKTVRIGLGPGENSTVIFDSNVGTTDKPKLSLIRSTLKKHAISKSTAGRGFKQLWTSPTGKPIKIVDAINAYKNIAAPKSIVENGSKVLWNRMPGWVVKVDGDNIEIKLKGTSAVIKTNIKEDKELKII